MESEIRKILDEAEKAVGAVDKTDLKTLSARINDIRVRFLGKSGEFALVYRNMKDLPPEQRPAFGKAVNDAKEQAEAIIAALEKEAERLILENRLATEKIDITLPAKRGLKGTLHPINMVRTELTDYFVSLGFEVAGGPDIETDYYNFQALNLPEDHPARDAQDTFFITDNLLLRTQTSAAQVRTMEKKQPPIKMVSPGRVFRADEVDATHSPVFHQFEGLVVDKGITMCDLKGILNAFAKKIFGDKTEIRLRPSYFPFTEPSVEMDASCGHCGGKGCRACKGAGWIEILGAGMVNRKVLAGCGIDPDVYTGFAFGVGIDRMAKLKYGVADLRSFFENDVRFLKQFR